MRFQEPLTKEEAKKDGRVHLCEEEIAEGVWRWQNVKRDVLELHGKALLLPDALKELVTPAAFSRTLRQLDRCCAFVTSTVDDGRAVQFDVYFTTPAVFGVEFTAPRKAVALIVWLVDNGATAELSFILDDLAHDSSVATVVDQFLPNLEKLWALILPSRLLPEATQPAELTSLRRYQLRCVKWMIDRERHVGLLEHPLDIAIKTAKDKTYYMTRDFTLRREPLIKMPDIVSRTTDDAGSFS